MRAWMKTFLLATIVVAFPGWLGAQQPSNSTVDQVVDRITAREQKEVETVAWLPPGKITVGITAGASCPNNLLEDAIKRLFELRGISVQELLAN